MLINTNIILENKIYKEALTKLNKQEEDRVFCRHNLEHFLDVARIAYIEVLEKSLNYSKDLIYSIGLLHDIGRVLQYEKGIPHHEGSVILSEQILEETSFSKEEKDTILKAIEEHRGETTSELSEIINNSDKRSRACFNCKAQKDCYWSEEKKNHKLFY